MHFPRPFLLLVLIEAIILVCSLYIGEATSWVGFEFSGSSMLSSLPSALGYTAILLTIMFSLGVYNPIVTLTFYQVVIRLSVSFVLGFIVLSAIFYAFPDLLIWRSVMAGALVSGFVGMLAAHYIFLHAIDLTPLKHRIAVIGSGAQAAQIDRLERKERALGFICMGFFPIDGETTEIPPARMAAPDIALEDFVRRYNVDEIVIASEERRLSLPLESLTECAFQGVDVIDYLSFWEREASRVDIDALPRNWMQFVISHPGGRVHHFIKRLFDIVISSSALIILLPLMACTAIAVKLDSSGPVFYRQRRVGLRGETFELLKFRSMRLDAEQDGVPRWAAGQDDRVTPIGAFIRKTRIDEIPQMINVLRGQMSFVGPRPERPYFVEQLAKEIPYFRERLRVKPGITGWAQLNYPYGASVEDARHKLEYDLFYIRHYGLMLDTIIVLQTLHVVLWPHKQA